MDTDITYMSDEWQALPPVSSSVDVGGVRTIDSALLSDHRPIAELADLKLFPKASLATLIKTIIRLKDREKPFATDVNLPVLWQDGKRRSIGFRDLALLDRYINFDEATPAPWFESASRADIFRTVDTVNFQSNKAYQRITRTGAAVLSPVRSPDTIVASPIGVYHGYRNVPSPEPQKPVGEWDNPKWRAEDPVVIAEIAMLEYCIRKHPATGHLTVSEVAHAAAHKSLFYLRSIESYSRLPQMLNPIYRAREMFPGGMALVWTDIAALMWGSTVFSDEPLYDRNDSDQYRTIFDMVTDFAEAGISPTRLKEKMTSSQNFVSLHKAVQNGVDLDLAEEMGL